MTAVVGIPPNVIPRVTRSGYQYFLIPNVSETSTSTVVQPQQQEAPITQQQPIIQPSGLVGAPGVQYQVFPPFFAPGPGGRGYPEVYRRFLGTPPESTCTLYLDKTSCEAPGHACRWIQDVLGRNYCRGFPGAVTSQFPAGTTVRAVPTYEAGGSHCLWLPENECKAREAQGCRWIQNVLGSNYCTGLAGSTIPYSTQFVGIVPPAGGVGVGIPPTRYQPAEAHLPRAFSASGRFNPRAYSEEEKQTWYLPNTLDEDQRKYCDCTLEVAASNLQRFGTAATYGPYRVCNARIAGSHGRQRGLGPSGIAALRSKLALTSSTGMCTTMANFQNMPTDLLFAYARMHQLSRSSAPYFPPNQVPSVQQYLQNPEAFRPQLLRLLLAYQQKERATKPTAILPSQ